MERVVGLVLKRIAPEAEDSINYRFLAEKTTNLLDKPNNTTTEPDDTATKPKNIVGGMTVDKLADAAKAGAKASKLPKGGKILSILGAGLAGLYSDFAEAQEKAKEDLSKNPRRYTDEEIQAFYDAVRGKPRDANNKQKNDANNNDILANLYSTLAEAREKTEEDLTGSTKYSDKDIQAFHNTIQSMSQNANNDTSSEQLSFPDPTIVDDEPENSGIMFGDDIRVADELRKRGIPEDEIWDEYRNNNNSLSHLKSILSQSNTVDADPDDRVFFEATLG